jgi:hypothetical protein
MPIYKSGPTNFISLAAVNRDRRLKTGSLPKSSYAVNEFVAGRSCENVSLLTTSSQRKNGVKCEPPKN